MFCSLYYKYDPLRAAACPLTIHALLHIAPSIRIAGPVWAYWAFPMERYCGDIGLNIRSRRHPYKSIDHYVTAHAQLAQVTLLHDLHQELSLERPAQRERQLDFSSPHCRSTYFLVPTINLSLRRSLRPKRTADCINSIQFFEEPTHGIVCDSARDDQAGGQPVFFEAPSGSRVWSSTPA